MKSLICKLFLFGLVTTFVPAILAANEPSPELMPTEKSPKQSSEKPKKLYRVVDQYGNVSYSDTPSPGAKEIVLPDPPTIKIIRTPEIVKKNVVEPEEQQQTNVEQYSHVAFENVTDDGVIRNNGGVVTLTASLQPALRNEHFLKFFLDGKLLQEQQKELTVTAENIEYGPHIASFSIVSNDGTIVQSSGAIKFNLLHIVRPKTGAVNRLNDNPFNNEMYKPKLPELPQIPTYESIIKTNETDN